MIFVGSAGAREVASASGIDDPESSTIWSPSRRPHSALSPTATRTRRRSTVNGAGVSGVPGIMSRSPSVQLDPDRHALDAVEEVRPQPLDRPIELERADPRQELLEDDADLEPREMSAEADVHAARA